MRSSLHSKCFAKGSAIRAKQKRTDCASLHVFMRKTRYMRESQTGRRFHEQSSAIRISVAIVRCYFGNSVKEFVEVPYCSRTASCKHSLTVAPGSARLQASATAQATTSTLILQVKNVRNKTGVVRFALFTAQDGWPDDKTKAARYGSLPANGGTVNLHHRRPCPLAAMASLSCMTKMKTTSSTATSSAAPRKASASATIPRSASPRRRGNSRPSTWRAHRLSPRWICGIHDAAAFY